MPRAKAKNSRFFRGLMESAASPSMPRGAITTRTLGRCRRTRNGNKVKPLENKLFK